MYNSQVRNETRRRIVQVTCPATPTAAQLEAALSTQVVVWGQGEVTRACTGAFT